MDGHDIEAVKCPKCGATQAQAIVDNFVVPVTPFVQCECTDDCPIVTCLHCGYRGHVAEFMEGFDMARAKYNPELQDPDPDFHPSKMTFREVELALYEGREVFWRRCKVCGKSIFIRKNETGLPYIVSCACRAPGKSPCKEVNWDQLQALVNTGRIPLTSKATAE